MTTRTASKRLSGVRFRNQYGLSAQSFHPKIGGARLYANALEHTMAGMSPQPSEYRYSCPARSSSWTMTAGPGVTGERRLPMRGGQA